MFELIKSYIAYGIQLFKDDPYLLVILLGIVASWVVTQGVKSNLFPDAWTDKKHKQMTWLTSILAGTVFSFFLWHYKEQLGVPVGLKSDPGGFDFLCSLMVGFASPSAHWLVTRLLYWKWPALEGILSTRPAPVSK